MRSPARLASARSGRPSASCASASSTSGAACSIGIGRVACRRSRSRPASAHRPLRAGAPAAPWRVCGCEPRSAPVSSARLAVRRVAPAPAAVLAQLEPLRVVPLALVRLVIPALALFAGESRSDPDVSTGHLGASRRWWSGLGHRTAGVTTNAARRRAASVALVRASLFRQLDRRELEVQPPVAAQHADRHRAPDRVRASSAAGRRRPARPAAPPSSTIRSSARSPARCAGLPGATSTTSTPGCASESARARAAAAAAVRRRSRCRRAARGRRASARR